MAKEKRFNETPVAEIPEVSSFERLQEEYQAFRKANPEFFKYLEALAERYNSALEAADKAVRARQISCGDFALYQIATKYNADILFQGMGHDRALAVGGIASTRTVYEVDKTRVEASIASGAIPPAIADQVKKQEPRYKKPSKLELP